MGGRGGNPTSSGSMGGGTAGLYDLKGWGGAGSFLDEEVVLVIGTGIGSGLPPPAPPPAPLLVLALVLVLCAWYIPGLVGEVRATEGVGCG